MRLVKLEAENIKRLRIVRFIPKAGVNLVRGFNENGKSSLLDSIEYLFGGVKSHPPEVIRKGEEKAVVIGETPDLIATRRWWRAGDGDGNEVVKTELIVVAKDTGLKLDSPQKVLDKMYPAESDPTAFFRMKGPERRDWLMKVVGVDPAALDKRIDAAFEARKLSKRDLAAAETRLKGTMAEKPPPAIDTAALLKEQAEAVQLQRACAEAVNVRAAALRRMTDASEAVRVAEMALEQAKARFDTATKHAAEADNVADAAEEAAEKTAATLERVREALQKASAVGMAHARWTEREKLVAEVTRLTADETAKETELEPSAEKRRRFLAKAVFPVEGLGFGDGDVTFKGLPLEQASGAQRIRIGAAVLTARDPKLRFMRVPHGGDLDEENLAVLAEFCDEHEMQCFVEVPGESGPATVIRDGEVYEP